MTKIIVIPAKDNSRNRRRKLRGDHFKASAIEREEEKRRNLDQIKSENDLNGASDSVMKAILIPVVAKDVSLAKEPKDDVMNHKVNHAHQRDPRKKW
ncbi:TPA: hypothetical protein ACGSU1_000461 [Yersinia enterocolitica]